VKLESMRVDPLSTNPIVLTASGGNLMNRIKRLVETPSSTRVMTFGRTPLALILGSLLVAVSIANIDSVEASVSSPVVQERDRGEERGRDAARGQDRDERRGDLSFPDTEEVMERASIALEEGEITREQLSAIMRWHERYSMGIENGRMNAEDAARGWYDRLEGLMESNERDERDGRDDREDDVAKRVGMMMVELGMAVDSGDMSPEDAIRKVMDLARRMRVDTTPEHAPADQRRARAAYAEAVEKMKGMLEAGEITREQMEERLEGMKRRMAMASGAERQPSITKADYEEASKKMLKMVESGKISREQMQQRLDEMKRVMVEGAGSKRTMSKEDYDRAVDRMVEAVKAGKMTREQMQERLDRLNKELKGDGSKEQKKMTRADFDAAVEKMTKMVEAGEITREDMRRRLGEMRRMIAEQSEESEKVDDPRKAYEALKRRLDMGVESGRMTQEQADERLAEFRRSLGR
jgi:polyhydroxyalkanoate synthesis regulator phasin